MSNISRYSELLKLVQENPTLPVVPLVDSEIVFDDGYCRWLGQFGDGYSGEYTAYKDRYYTDRDSFKERYYDDNCDELCEKFNYSPCICLENAFNTYTAEQVELNKKNEQKLEAYLDKVAEEHFIKAIIVNIDCLS